MSDSNSPRSVASDDWNPFAGWTESQMAAPTNVADMADALGVKRATFVLWARTGRVPAFQVGKRWVCTPLAVLADIKKDRGIFAKADTSVVYDRLQRKLAGAQQTPSETAPGAATAGTHPGLTEPQRLEAPSVEGTDAQQVVDVAGLAALLKCSTATVYRMARNDEIPSFSVGNRWRFEVERVLDALQQPADLWKQPGRSWSANRRR